MSKIMLISEKCLLMHTTYIITNLFFLIISAHMIFPFFFSVTTWILQGIILLSYFTTPIHAIPLYLTANTPVTEELRHLKPNQTSHPQSPVEKIFSSPPKWHNPCGAPTKNNQNNNNNNPINIPNTMSNDIFGLFNSNVEHPSDSDLMHGIISIAKVALRQSRFFKEDYVSFI